MQQLSQRDQEVVALKYGAGLNNREIASLTGLGESNVGTLLHRAVHELRSGWDSRGTQP
jgi:RNA polymerase sigma-70 factor (ECF subfamily)